MKTDHPRALLAIGALTKAFGLRGELVVLPMTDEPARFRRLRTVLLGANEAAVSEVPVEHVAVEPRGIRIKLRGVDDRTGAEALIGQLLFIDRKHRIRLPAGRYFIHDIEGLEVVDEVRGSLGVVREVLQYPAHDVYVVAQEGREMLIPAVKEFIRSVDLPAKRMTVRIIDGMDGEE